MIGRFPAISAAAPRETALEFVLEWGRGAGKAVQIGAPTVGKALDAYLARPNLRYEVHKNLLRQQFGMHLKDWLKLPLAATPSGAITFSSLSGLSGSMPAAPMSCRKARRWPSSGSRNSRTGR